jgi:hypothetical protein
MLVNTIVGIKFEPQTPKGTNFLSLHEDMPREVKGIFVNQPLNQGGGDSNPPRPLRYFGLPMVHPSRPPLPPNIPYCRPLNYHEYVKDFDPNVHVRVFKVAIRANNEIDDAEIVNMFTFTPQRYYV